MKITANNPNRKSWLPVEKDSDFPIQNIPFGVFWGGSLGELSSVHRLKTDPFGSRAMQKVFQKVPSIVHDL